MSGPTCATCRFFQTFGDGGHCYRYPPREGDSKVNYPNAMWCGEHAPTPAVGSPELPEGWEWDTNFPGITRAVGRGNPRCIVEIMPNGIVTAMGAYVEDVEAVIAAHRARAGGAS